MQSQLQKCAVPHFATSRRRIDAAIARLRSWSGVNVRLSAPALAGPPTSEAPAGRESERTREGDGSPPLDRAGEGMAVGAGDGAVEELVAQSWHCVLVNPDTLTAAGGAVRRVPNGERVGDGTGALVWANKLVGVIGWARQPA